VLGLLLQDVRDFFVILGHGSTDLGEALRVYEQAGALRTRAFRNEVEMVHAATALRWLHGVPVAVVTSIGPGALQAMAAGLVASSNRVGVWHIYGDETTHDEGYNMQQVPRPEQGLFGRLTAVMGESYVLHTPAALRTALRRGSLRVNHPTAAGPFHLLLPINVQPQAMRLNLAALPGPQIPPRVAVADAAAVTAAAELIRRHRRVVIKAGGGARTCAAAIARLAEAADAVVVLSPGSLGVLPDAHPRNMHVGGSKGSISGNFAMAEADLLIVVGSRAVCQSDCSGIGWPKARAVVNLNADLADAAHYNRTIMLPGDAGAAIDQLVAALAAAPPAPAPAWRAACGQARAEWDTLRADRAGCPPLHDPVWGRSVLTQPAAIAAVQDFARSIGAVCIYDAGDVQANGFQMARDDQPLQTLTETGASYMGFAASALLGVPIGATAPPAIALCGDGSFLMNPQVLVDAVAHGVRGIVVVLDNRRMAAISALQVAQYGAAHATWDGVAVDYAAMANAVASVRGLHGGFDVTALRAALEAAHAHPGLSLVHVPVYHGDDPRGGLGAYGDWNVGNWVEDVQRRYDDQDL
jgi:3D-(3,5/4)-trihydroxycyclohexane-1,2-dione acylhydrolase (decyclizing)